MLNFTSGSITTRNTDTPNKRITIDKNICLLLLCGVYNFESLYIGHHAKFERFPQEVFNSQLMMQLQVFGYIYQKRLVPKELEYKDEIHN